MIRVNTGWRTLVYRHAFLHSNYNLFAKYCSSLWSDTCTLNFFERECVHNFILKQQYWSKLENQDFHFTMDIKWRWNSRLFCLMVEGWTWPIIFVWLQRSKILQIVLLVQNDGLVTWKYLLGRKEQFEGVQYTINMETEYLASIISPFSGGEEKIALIWLYGFLDYHYYYYYYFHDSSAKINQCNV